MTGAAEAQSQLAILLVLVGVTAISVNDMLVKLLSGGYPLHQIVFVRSAVALVICLALLPRAGGWRSLATARPGLHALRAGLIVLANMLFFAAIAVMPLGAATALFFVAPLFITLLPIPVLGERVGRHRMGAILVGFAGVAVMMAPGVDWGGIPRWALALPVAAAACYAGMQVLTRKLGGASSAVAMAVYIQMAFLAVALVVFVVAGDGRIAEGRTDPALVFLMRAWTWPEAPDLALMLAMGVLLATVALTLSQAYRIGAPATVASFEYVALPLALVWGFVVFGEVPLPVTWAGMALIGGAGLYVFARERAQGRRRRGAVARR